MSTSLTATQQQILNYAHEHTEGKITWFPDNIKGGARQKILESLANRELIVCKRKEWFITAQGYDALGLPRKSPVTKQAIETVVKEATATGSRANSKQAQVIAMLKSPEGATLKQICEATGWQQHTVRGAFAGAFKKKLGLNITSTKESGAERIYKLST